MEEIIKILVEKIEESYIATASDEFGPIARSKASTKHSAVELCKLKVNRRTTKNTFRKFVIEDLIYEGRAWKCKTCPGLTWATLLIS